MYPTICVNLGTDHSKLISLYRKARAIPGIKKVLISSGLRYDLAVRSPEYVKELVTHHVGGLLKIAPEHTEEGTLSKMMKPGIGAYDEFKRMFDKFSLEAGKKQYLIPYFIAAHPGTTDEDMLNLALWLKKNNFKLDQVQTFTPTPMAMATTMYHTRKNPLHKVTADSEVVETARSGKMRTLAQGLPALPGSGELADPARGAGQDGPWRPDRQWRPPPGAGWQASEDGGLAARRAQAPDARAPARCDKFAAGAEAQRPRARSRRRRSSRRNRKVRPSILATIKTKPKPAPPPPKARPGRK